MQAMEVYIEYVVLDNLAINTVLLYATALTLKTKASFWRILLAAAVGTVFAIALPLFALPPVLLALTKVLLAPLIAFLAFGCPSVPKLVGSTLLFVAYTFLLGGSIIAFLYIGMNLTLEKAAVYYSASLPVGLYIGGIAFFAFVAAKIYKLLKNSKRMRQSLTNVTVYFDDKAYRLLGLIDSGNTLFNMEKPVCFVTDKKLSAAVKRKIAENILVGRETIKGDFVTVAGVSAYRGLLAELETGGARQKVALALTSVKNVEYGIILNGVFGEEIDENNRQN